MKAILLSVKPKWVAKILNGEKTVEVRKRFPLNYCGWVYIYCTKGKYEIGKFRSDNLYHEIRDDCCYAGGWLRGLPNEIVNGKVVARFYCDNVEIIDYEEYGYGDDEEEMFDWYFTKTISADELLKRTCLRRFEIANYLQREKGYAIYISQLEIFDKPKELSDFYSLIREKEKTDCPLNCKYLCINNYECKYYVEDDGYGGQLACTCPTKEVNIKKSLTRSPESWQYIEVGD